MFKTRPKKCMIMILSVSIRPGRIDELCATSCLTETLTECVLLLARLHVV